MGKTDLLESRKETEHFKFFCMEKDVICLENLSGILEYNCKKILHDLNLTLEEKVEVKIYPDIKTFHEEVMEDADSPEWLVGTAQSGLICIVSPLNPGPVHNYASILKTAVHEFTHTLVKKVNCKGVWRFLDEGLALFEAEQMDNKHKVILANMISRKKIPTINELESDFIGQSGFIFAYTIVEYIIKRYGFDKLNELIRNPSDFRKIFNTTEDEFEKEWVEFLNEYYRACME
ncbi:MAG: hypothetical protein HPY74_03955 [Firmicutes bacterium]|nr:hypothetical protein [Bacillota bacterium]